MQKHAARRLHYDLRLELDGVLKSWAVTRGPSLTLGEKRLAVRTEDHPIEYLDFEGNIPKGEYGGGSMIVWDRGRWTPVGDPHKGLAKGHLEFALDGARLKGRWHLVRMKPRRGEKSEPWLLIKAEDEFARHPGDPEITEEETTSRISGRTNEELAAAGALRDDHSARVGAGKRRKLPAAGHRQDRRRPQGPAAGVPRAEPRRAVRQAAERAEMDPRDQARRLPHPGAHRRQQGAPADPHGLDWTARFRGIADALAELGLGSALIDGEIVVEDDGGITNLSHLQADLQSGRRDRFRYFTFDLLYCDGYDLTKASLVDRKELLAQIIAVLPPTSPIRFSEHLEADGPTMLAHTCRLGLEGIISKRKDLPYRPGRGHHWFKAKCMQSQEFVILGYVASTAASGAIGSLALGYHADGKLTYAGRVGTGWSEALAKSLRKELDKIRAAKPALAKPLPAGAEKGVVWVEPRLVCEVEYRDWTRDGLIRNSSFKGLAGGQAGDGDHAGDAAANHERAATKAAPPRRRSSSPIPSASCGRSPASPSRASPISTPTSPTGFCRTSPGAC